jgi:hypothetical protein
MFRRKWLMAIQHIFFGRMAYLTETALVLMIFSFFVYRRAMFS